MYTEADINKVRDIILKNISDVKKIILFGSYSTGEYTEESDMDFLILTEKKFDRKYMLSVLTQVRWESALSGYKADFLLKSFNDFARDKNKPTLSNVIYREGKILWKAAGKNTKSGSLKQKPI